MKIILINKYLYPKGGDAISTLNTGKLLSSKGHNVIFWGMHYSFNTDLPHKDLFTSTVDFDKLPGLAIKAMENSEEIGRKGWIFASQFTLQRFQREWLNLVEKVAGVA